jgi:hypothetical protein
VTGSRKNNRVTTRVRCWEVGSGEPTIAMVR